MVPFSSPKVFDFWPLLHKGQIFFCSDWEYFWSAGSGWQIGILCQNLSFIGQLEPIRQHYPTKFSPFSTQTRAETFSPWGKKTVLWIEPKIFLDESTHKKAQFEESVKYFTRIWTGLLGYVSNLDKEKCSLFGQNFGRAGLGHWKVQVWSDMQPYPNPKLDLQVLGFK